MPPPPPPTHTHLLSHFSSWHACPNGVNNQEHQGRINVCVHVCARWCVCACACPFVYGTPAFMVDREMMKLLN